VLMPTCRDLKYENIPHMDDLVWGDVFEKLLEFQQDNNLLTLADLVYLTVRRLAEDAPLRHRCQENFDAILVDEFQDLNAGQLALVELLACAHNNLFVVADDDQMIYSWRGANIDQIRQFPEIYQPCHQAIISTNYRSAKDIIRQTGFLISRNTIREDKEIKPRPSAAQGSVTFCFADGLAPEREFLTDSLMKARRNGYSWKDIAVLTRYREMFFPIVDALEQAKIPYGCEDFKFFSRPAARAVIGYLLAILKWPNPPHRIWGDILNAPNRYLSNSYVTQVMESSDPVEFLTGSKTRLTDDHQYDRIDRLLRQLERLHREFVSNPKNSYELVEEIDRFMRLTIFYRITPEFSSDNDTADQGLIIETLKMLAQRMSDPHEFVRDCRERREVEEERAAKGGRRGHHEPQGLQVLTIHKAKGKEWKGVVLFHVEPPRHLDSKDVDRESYLEEERRVIYVGATRVKDDLWVTAKREERYNFAYELCKNPIFDGVDIDREYAKCGQEEKNLRLRRQQIESEIQDLGIDLDLEDKVLKNEIDKADSEDDLNNILRKVKQEQRLLQSDLSPMGWLLWYFHIRPKKARALGLAQKIIRKEKERAQCLAILNRCEEVMDEKKRREQFGC